MEVFEHQDGRGRKLGFVFEKALFELGKVKFLRNSPEGVGVQKNMKHSAEVAI